MKNRFRFMLLLLTFALLVSQGALTAYAETEGTGEGGNVTAEADTMSSDATLSSLKIAQAALSPEFSSNQMTYTATVPYEVERVALTAQTTFPGATKVIRGTSDLEVGENIITVTVTAEDGTVREYRITLVRQAMQEPVSGENNETQEPSQTDEGGSEVDTSEADPEETTEDNAGDTTEDPNEETAEQTPEETSPQENLEETTKANGGMIVETTADASWDLESLLANPMMLIGIGGAIVVVSLCAIVVAVIVLRENRRGDDDDDEEEELDEDECNEVIVTDPDEDFEEIVEDDLDDDFEMLLEDDDDFDFLEF